MAQQAFDIERLRAGDEDALSALFKYLSPQVRRLVVSYGASELDADEVLSEVFVRLLRDSDRLADIASKGNLVAYCLHLARNTVLHHQRRSRRQKEYVPALKDRAEEPIDHSAVQEAYQAVEEAISHLDEESRRLVTMRYVENRSPTEIAETLGVSANVVRVRLHRVMQGLRAALDIGADDQ